MFVLSLPPEIVAIVISAALIGFAALARLWTRRTSDRRERTSEIEPYLMREDAPAPSMLQDEIAELVKEAESFGRREIPNADELADLQAEIHGLAKELAEQTGKNVTRTASMAAPPHRSRKGRLADAESDRLTVVEKPSLGTIFYNPPNSMVTHRVKRIIARIINDGALETLEAQIFEDLGGRETVKHFKLKTTRSMFVELHGQKGIFSISSLSPPNPQRLDNDRGFAEWVWDVTPLKRGLHELTLIVSCYESNSEGGHCHVVNIPPVVTKIRIRVNKTKKVRQMAIAASLLLVGTAFDEEMKTDYPEMHKAARHYIASFLDFSTPQPLEKVTPVGEKRQEAEKGPPGPEKSP